MSNHPEFMFKQNMLYREHALGNFDDLVHKSSKDLAMLIYLDPMKTMPESS